MKIRQIVEKTNQMQFDTRMKLMLDAYLYAKCKKEQITEDRIIDEKLETLANNIKHIEFIKSPKFKILYEEAGKILSIKEDYLKGNNIEELIGLLFMKMESFIEQQEEELHSIKSFLKGHELITMLNLPTDSKQKAINQIFTAAFGKEGQDIEKYTQQDRSIQVMCSELNNNFEKQITTGEIEASIVEEAINIVKYQILTDQEQGIDIRAEHYKQKIKQLKQGIEGLKIEKYRYTISELSNLVGEENETPQRIEDNQKNENLLKEMQNRLKEMPEEVLNKSYIKDRVKELIEEKTGYDSNLTILLEEFFVRSSTIYQWSRNQFEERINNVESRINQMGFEFIEDIDIMGEASKDKVKMNERVFLNSQGALKTKDKDLLLRLAIVFFHEMGHITDETKRQKVKVREPLGKPLISDKFYEWTNVIFERAMMGDLYEDSSAMFLKGTSYNQFQNAGCIIAAALGMDEIEFAKLKDKGLEETSRFFDEKYWYIPGVFQKIASLFNQGIDDKITGRKAKAMYQVKYNEIYTLAMEIFNTRIAHEMQSGEINNVNEYQLYQSYYLKKINRNQKKAVKNYGMPRKSVQIQHQTPYVTDKIRKQDEERIAREIKEKVNFGFDNQKILHLLQTHKRKNSLKDRWKVNLLGRKKIKLIQEPGRESQVDKNSRKLEQEVNR